MFGRGLIVKAASLAAMTACVAAAITALIFAVCAGVFAALLGYRPEPQEEAEPEGLTDRAIQLFRTRPILGTVAGLAAGWIFLRNPALATMVAAAFTEKAHTTGRRRR